MDPDKMRTTKAEDVGEPGHTWGINPNPPTTGADPPPAKDTVPTYRHNGLTDVDDKQDRLLAIDELVSRSLLEKPQYYTIHPDAWTRSSGGRVLVEATRFDKKVWLDRAYLVDPAYPTTVGRIDELRKLEDDELKDFWAEKANGEFAVGKSVTLVRDTAGALVGEDGPGEPSTVPAGRHPIVAQVTWRADPTQRTPFSVVVRVHDVEVALSPDAAGGVQTAHIQAATTLGLANRVNAVDLCETFTTVGDDLISENLPKDFGSGWLTDGQLHYVDDEEMGKLYVAAVAPWLADDHGPRAEAFRQRLIRLGELTAGLHLGNHIYVKETACGTGVEYHEALHRLSAEPAQQVLGPDFNEGVTEYFTRRVLAGGIAVVRDPDTYGQQLQGVEALITSGVITPYVLAAAYFKGAVWKLFDAVDSHPALGGRFSLQGYAHKLGDGNGHAARAYLKEMLARS